MNTFSLTLGDVSLKNLSQQSVAPTVDLGYHHMHIFIELRMIDLRYSVDGIVLLTASDFSVKSGYHQTVLTISRYDRKEFRVF